MLILKCVPTATNGESFQAKKNMKSYEREYMPEDMSPDGGRVWAFDKTNVPKPPPGWDRVVRLRGASSKFADVWCYGYFHFKTQASRKKDRDFRRYNKCLELDNVRYYTSPSGKTLRSSAEIGRYLADNPQDGQGVQLSQFSFATPKPRHEVNLKKPKSEGHGSPELAKADQLCSAAPTKHRELLGEPSCLSSEHADLYQPKVPGHSHLHRSGRAVKQAADFGGNASGRIDS
ncbi:hypothetical protein EJB05_26980, partial [Eragrostis curvula]